MTNVYNSERYNRNTIISEIGEVGQLKILNSKILIAGAGGLGSTVIANMASVGVGSIGIIDNDNLELSNLNRQYLHKISGLGKSKVKSAKNWVKEFNTDINVDIFELRLDETNYKEIICQFDIVIDCFDSYKSKFLLNKICAENNKPLIHGGVTEFYGQVMTIIPDKSSCLNCFLSDDPQAYVVKGVISPSVSIIASIQSMEAVKLIVGIGELLTNQLLIFDGLKLEFRKIKIDKNENCHVCKPDNQFVKTILEL